MKYLILITFILTFGFINAQYYLDHCQLPDTLSKTFSVVSFGRNKVNFQLIKDSTYIRTDFYKNSSIKSETIGIIKLATDTNWTEDSEGNLYPLTVQGYVFSARGKHITYYKLSKSKKSDGELKRFKQIGLWSFWNEKGNLISQKTFN